MRNLLTLKTRMLAVVMMLLCGVSARANDGAYYVSGNQLVPLQETDISIRKEVLTIYLQDDHFAKVDVYYEFWNPGPAAKRLLMGFEAGAPYNCDGLYDPTSGHPNILDFTVEMNGRRLNFQNAPCVPNTAQRVQLDPTKRYFIDGETGTLYVEGESTEDEYGNVYVTGDYIVFSYVYYFDAEFQPGLNVVHHTYLYRMSELNTLPWLLDYKLTPASRWAGGKIGDFTLVVRAEKTAKHFQIPESTFKGAEFEVKEGFGKMRVVNNTMDWDKNSPKSYEVSLRNGAVSWHKKDFRPEMELNIYAMGVDYFQGISASYDRSSDIFFYFGDEVETDRAFLKRVIHNMPYAHRGHVFKDKRLKKYFEGLWWYMPDPNYKDSTDDFTEVDWLFFKGEIEE